VIPFYEGDLFFPPTVELQRHLFLSNFNIRPFEFEREQVINTTKPSDSVFGFNISKYKLKHRKDQILRNLVNPELGLYILEQARGIIRESKSKQQELSF
jgi:hypothetical protein